MIDVPAVTTMILPGHPRQPQSFKMLTQFIMRRAMPHHVKFRKVLNDAVVGEWHDVDFPVFPPTLEGLKAALAAPAQAAQGWDPAKLEWPGGFDDHLVNYGLRIQFRILLPEEAEAVVQEARLYDALQAHASEIAEQVGFAIMQA